MKISLIIPAYNEKAIISNTILQAKTYMQNMFEDYEIIIVDDGSTDGMVKDLYQIAGDKIKIYSYLPNKGKGHAVKYGVLRATGDILFYTDTDLAYGLEPICKGVKLLADGGIDIVIGTRKTTDGYKSYPLSRKIVSKGFSCLTKVVLGLPYDTQCGFKGFKKKAGKEIFNLCNSDSFAFDFEVLMIANQKGFKIEQIPVSIINHRQ